MQSYSNSMLIAGLFYAFGCASSLRLESLDHSMNGDVIEMEEGPFKVGERVHPGAMTTRKRLRSTGSEMYWVPEVLQLSIII